MFVNIKKDLQAGFGVFLLALPLSLGIAILSNFPPIAGIFSAVVGGIVCSLLGGARFAIKGPATGLVIMILTAVQELGAGDLALGYRRTLAVGAVAGLVQILIAVCRKAIFAEIVPTFVIHGMLAAIGVIIVSKQSFVLMGIVPPLTNNPFELLVQLPFYLKDINPILFCLSALTLGILIFWPKLKRISFVPASIVVLLCIIPISVFYQLNTDQSYLFLNRIYYLSSSLFINLPVDFWNALQFPDFSMIFDWVSLKHVFLFVLIGSIESLLTVCALDSLKQVGKAADLNRDLFSLGIGNVISSLIGGLPMISQIVRSKANIDYGATSIWSNFFHGLFMLLAILYFPQLLNYIPLSVLAALLIIVGLKLSAPKEFRHASRVGKDQFAIFMTTFLVTLLSDLLLGVLMGILVKLIFHIFRSRNLKNLFYPRISVERINENLNIKIEGTLTFISYLRLKKKLLEGAKLSSSILIDLKAVTFLDHTVLNKLLTLDKEFPENNIVIEQR